MNIRLLLPEEVLEKWSILSPFIQEALATGQGENTLADHMRKLMNFESHCWLITDNEEVLGAGLTEFIQYTRHKTLHIITIAGNYLISILTNNYYRVFKLTSLFLESLWNIFSS